MLESGTARASGRRSPPEATALLVELGRAVKGREFYAPDDPQQQQVLSRAVRVWQGELGRAGALEIEVTSTGIRVPALGHKIARVHLGSLVAKLLGHGIRSLRLEPDLDPEGFVALVDFLAGEAPGVVDAERVYRRVPHGIVVNRKVPSETPAPGRRPGPSLAEPARPAATAPADAASSTVAKPRIEAPATRAATLARPPEPHAEPSAPAPAEPVLAEPARSPSPSAPAASAPRPEPTAPDDARHEPVARHDAWQEPVARDDAPQEALSISEAHAPLPVLDEAPTEPELSFGPGGPRLDPPAPAAPEPDGDDAPFDFEATRAPAPPSPQGRDETAILAPPGYEEELELDEEIGDFTFAFDRTDPDRTPELEETPVEVSDTDTTAVEAGPPVSSDTDTDVTIGPDGRAAQLKHLLHELEECDDDAGYNDMARRACVLAETLSDEGHTSLGYHTLELLTAHSLDEKARSPRQRQLAREYVETLARGSRVDELIERSCAADPRRALAATQLLLRIGEPVVAPLFRAATRERDPNRRGELQGILIAMGEALLPALIDAMSSEEPAHVRTAIRLAGESQNPGTVPRLEEFLDDGPSDLRQEAAKALVRIGDARSVEALARALDHPEGEVPSLAAYCLGATTSGRAVEALLGALNRALSQQAFPIAAELIRSLGRIGRPEAARALADVLLHRGMRHRKQFRELKLAAAAALGRIPGDAAAGALAQAAHGRDAQVRRAAQTALDRRTRSLTS